MKQILIVDDDHRFCRAIELCLSKDYQIKCAYSGAEARKLYLENKFDLILLDFNLGIENGHLVLDYFRQNQFRGPIIVLSGEVDLPMCVGFLKREVQYFFEKPFSFSELQDKIKELLSEDRERSGPDSKCGQQADQIEVNNMKRTVRLGSEEISLTKTEFQIFKFLLDRPNLKVNRRILIESIWGNTAQCKNNFDTHLLNLRKKIPQFTNQVQLVYGEGFFFAPNDEWKDVKTTTDV